MSQVQLYIPSLPKFLANFGYEDDRYFGTITLLSIGCYSCVYILWAVHLEHWVVQCNHQIVLRGPLWSTIERIIYDGFDKAPNTLPLLAAKKEEIEIDKGYGMALPQPLIQSVEHLSVKQNRYSVVIKCKKQLLPHSRPCTCMKSEGKAAASMEFIWLPSLIPRPVGTGTEGLEMRLLDVYGYSICVPQSFIVHKSTWKSFSLN